VVALVLATGVMAVFLVATPPLPARAIGPNQCPWPAHLDANTTNVAFPDQNANYYTLFLLSAPFTRLRITGLFPHARYMSFTTYTGQTQAIDGINDVHIIPDSGQPVDNPFIAGNSRNTSGSKRSYTVYVAKGQKPANPAPNTIYTTDADGSHSNATSFIVIYRTYRPDRLYPNDGGGGEPLPTVHADPGDTPIGDASKCSTAPDPNNGIGDIFTNGMLPQLPAGSANCYPGLSPPAWHKFTNIVTAEIQGTNNTCLSDNPQNNLTGGTDTLPRGGFLENLDNKYIAAILNVDNFPKPDQPNVLVVSSRVPTTPDTFPNTAVMPGGQLRYWSMCSNEGLTTRFYACVMDDGVTRLTNAGDYCLVVSRTSQRPRNANTRHKVNWLPFGIAHDNVLIERNMLPDPGFGQAIQSVAPGNEQKGLGAFYPTSTYLSVADFEKQGCPGFSGSTAFGTQPGDLTAGSSGSGLPNTAAPMAHSLAPFVMLMLGLMTAAVWGAVAQVRAKSGAGPKA
jgi:hypothetical protein